MHPSLWVSSWAGDPQGELLPLAFLEKYNLFKRLALGTQGVTHTCSLLGVAHELWKVAYQLQAHFVKQAPKPKKTQHKTPTENKADPNPDETSTKTARQAPKPTPETQPESIIAKRPRRSWYLRCGFRV